MKISKGSLEEQNKSNYAWTHVWAFWRFFPYSFFASTVPPSPGYPPSLHMLALNNSCSLIFTPIISFYMLAIEFHEVCEFRVPTD